MVMRLPSLVSVVVSGLVVLGCANAGDDSAAQEEQALGQDEAALAATLLAHVNTMPVAELAKASNATLAASLAAARPFASVAQLSAISGVGNATLQGLLRQAAPTEVTAGAGFWEKLLVTAAQAETIVEMANALDLTTLGCDLGLSSVGKRIVAARPIATMTQLADVPYVGASQLRRFKANLGWFGAGDALQARLDCVAFSDDELAAGLQFVNGAGFGQLCSVGSCGFSPWVSRVDELIAHRPWTSLDQIAATAGFGPAAMSAIRHGARNVIDGVSLGQDSVRGVLAAEVWGEWVDLGPTQVLDANVDVGVVYVPGTGYRLSSCQRIADAADPQPHASSELLCRGGCSQLTRYWRHQQHGLIFYRNGNCSLE
jgi:DNA uptake protein ComE-like DNA-binding protein